LTCHSISHPNCTRHNHIFTTNHIIILWKRLVLNFEQNIDCYLEIAIDKSTHWLVACMDYFRNLRILAYYQMHQTLHFDHNFLNIGYRNNKDFRFRWYSGDGECIKAHLRNWFLHHQHNCYCLWLLGAVVLFTSNLNIGAHLSFVRMFKGRESESVLPEKWYEEMGFLHIYGKLH
jgi:hypothetical protein